MCYLIILITVYGTRTTDVVCAASCFFLARRTLAGLRELDLDGNPCARSRGYKHRVIRCCLRLRELDGEEVVQLDRDLSALFFEEQQKETAWKTGGGEGVSSRGSSATRPATAPARSGRRAKRPFVAAAAVGEEGDTETSADKGAARVRGGRLPPGNVRLLKSDRLNNDPQVYNLLSISLTYLYQVYTNMKL